MSDADREPRLAQLTAELAWLRRLARALLGEDDVAHDTWIAGATRAPTDDRPLRPWLDRVARNLSRMAVRTRDRRIAREVATAELAEPAATPEQLVRRVEIQRLVAGEVLALAEPYRSPVLLHYFEELSCAEIARRHGLPDGTVRRRLKVALDQLRDRLAEPRSARGLAFLFPIAGLRPAPTIAPGVIVMKKLVVAIAIALLVVAAIWWTRRDDAATNPQARSLASASSAGAGALRTNSPAAGDHLPSWFAVRGAPPRRIAGRVTYQGAPAAGATVTLHHFLTRAGIMPALERRAGADGRFDLGTHPPRAYEVVASAPGKTAAIARIDVSDPTLRPPADALVLELGACNSSVSGTVFDASGGAIARAQIRRDGIVGVEADARGAYSLCLPRGDSEVTYGADGYGSVLLTIDAQGAAQQDVVLVPEAVLTGRVVDEADRAVADAQVRVFPAVWARDRGAGGTAVTGPDGRFRIAKLIPSRYRARASSDGGVTEIVEVLAEVGDDNAELTLRLAPHARVRGTVVSGGKPIAGAQVFAFQTSPPASSETAISQTDGTFVLERVPVGELSFSAAPYRVVTPSRLVLAKAADRDGVVIEVEKLGTIRGRVTRLGNPVAGARISGVPTVWSGDARFWSDASGRFEIRGVMPGTHDIGAQHDELGAFTEGTSITITAGEERVVDLELDLAATISGVVVDQHNRPVPNVFVRWTHEKTGDLGKSITDARGRFRCASMTGGGKYRAAVYATVAEQGAFPTVDGKPYPVLELANGRSTIEGVELAIELQRLTVAGRVVDSNGNPIADAQVRALAMQGDQAPVFQGWQKLPMTFTADDGSFTLSGLTSGRYAIAARSTDGGEATATNVAAGSSGVTVTIVQPGSIEGSLAEFPAQPHIAATRVDDPSGRYAGIVDRSTFRIAGVRPGRYVVTAQTTFEGDARIVEVRPNETIKVAMTARGRATIEATVLDFRTRAPIAGAMCHAEVASDGIHNFADWDWRVAPRSDARGRVTLDPAPAGTVTVSCMMPSNRLSIPAADITVKPGARGIVQLLSVELLASWPSTIGIELDYRVTAPRIARVTPNSPAATAGLVVGDLVTAVDAASVAGLNGNGVLHLIYSHATGSELTLTVTRGASTKSFTMVTVPRRYQ